MGEVRFTIKVVAVHPAYDNQGNEYVCVEFGYRPPRIPTMVPTDVPREVSEMIEASSKMVRVMVPPQLQAQMHRYANRLVIYLSTNEWENLLQKYTAGDEFEVVVKNDGGISVTRV
ncbi:MAG: hypothetical protein ACE5Z5_02450 [Candidatus Bathyarchaeia archaeon]